MPRRRQRIQDSISRARELQRERRMVEDLRFLSKRGKRPDPTNYRAVTTAARELRNREALEENYGRRVGAKQRDLLKARGFHTTKSKVVIDGPRDARRQKIKGARMSILKDGTVKWRVKERSDYVYGLTRAEKKQFAENPELFTKKILKRLQEKNPSLRKKRVQTRLQWGAFQATKDFVPQYFTRNIKSAGASPEDKSGKGNKKRALDKLTGLHFVVHTQKRKSRRAKTKTKGKRR